MTGHPWSPVSATSRIESGTGTASSPRQPVRRRREVASNGRDEPAVPAPSSQSGSAGAWFAVVPGSRSAIPTRPVPPWDRSPSARSAIPGGRGRGRNEARRPGAAGAARRPRTRDRGDPPALRQRPYDAEPPLAHRRPPPSGRRPRPPGCSRSARSIGSTSTARSPSTAPPAPLQGTVNASHFQRPGKLWSAGEAGLRHPVTSTSRRRPSSCCASTPDVPVQLQVGGRADGDLAGSGLMGILTAPAAGYVLGARPAARLRRRGAVSRRYVESEEFHDLARQPPLSTPPTACASWPPCSSRPTLTVGRCPAGVRRTSCERVKRAGRPRVTRLVGHGPGPMPPQARRRRPAEPRGSARPGGEIRALAASGGTTPVLLLEAAAADRTARHRSPQAGPDRPGSA